MPKLGGNALVGEARADVMRGRYLFESAQNLTGGGPGIESAKKTLEREANARLIEAKAALDAAATHTATPSALAIAKADYLVANKAPAADVDAQIAAAKDEPTRANDVAYVAAQLANREGHRADAIAALQPHAVATAPTTPVRNLYLAAQLLLANNDKVNAKVDLDAILQRFPQHDRAQTLLAGIDVPVEAPPTPGQKKVLAGEPKVGTEKVAAPSQGPADYRNVVAQAAKLFAQGKVKMARQMYQSGLALSPNGVEALRGIAFCDLDTEHFAPAIIEFRRVLARQPADSEALIGLGEAYRRAAMPQKAQEIFSRYVQQLPRGPRVKFAQKRLAEFAAMKLQAPPPTAATPLPHLAPSGEDSAIPAGADTKPLTDTKRRATRRRRIRKRPTRRRPTRRRPIRKRQIRRRQTRRRPIRKRPTRKRRTAKLRTAKRPRRKCPTRRRPTRRRQIPKRPTRSRAKQKIRRPRRTTRSRRATRRRMASPSSCRACRSPKATRPLSSA